MSMLIGNMYIILSLMVALATLDASQNYTESSIVVSWPLKFDINGLEEKKCFVGQGNRQVYRLI